MKGKAVFSFYDAIGLNGEQTPCFTVVKDEFGDANYSTVSGETLLSTFRMPLPLFPSYETWKHQIENKEKCKYCYAEYGACQHGEIK